MFIVENLHRDLKTTLQIKLYQILLLGIKQRLVTILINIHVLISQLCNVPECFPKSSSCWNEFLLKIWWCTCWWIIRNWWLCLMSTLSSITLLKCSTNWMLSMWVCFLEKAYVEWTRVSRFNCASRKILFKRQVLLSVK